MTASGEISFILFPLISNTLKFIKVISGAIFLTLLFLILNTCKLRNSDNGVISFILFPNRFNSSRCVNRQIDGGIVTSPHRDKSSFTFVMHTIY